jgi:hypothetical protein
VSSPTPRTAEAGGGDDDGFGIPLPNAGVMTRIKDALDPAGKCNPGRLPLVHATADAIVSS